MTLLLQVGRAVGLRCSSETDMSDSALRDDAGLLAELLSPKRCSRPPSKPPGPSGSLRRSRNSPSSSSSLAAEHELSAFLGMRTSDHRGGKREATAALSPDPRVTRSGPSSRNCPQSSRINTYSLGQNQQLHVGHMDPLTHSPPPQDSVSLQDHENHLVWGVAQCQASTIHPTEEATVTTSDHNKVSYGNIVVSHQETLSDHQTQSGSSAEPAGGNNPVGHGAEEREHSSVSVVVQRCQLVPELKVFDTLGHCEERSDSSHRGGNQREDGADDPQDLEAKKNTRVAVDTETGSPSFQREEEEGREEKVMVWCVTGVCEAAADLTLEQTEKNQCSVDYQGEGQAGSSAPCHHTRPQPQPTNQKPVPAPISSQPMPVSRCDGLSHPVSSPRWCQGETTSASEGPSLTTGASQEQRVRREQRDPSIDQRTNMDAATEQTVDDRNKSAMTSCHTTSENTKVASSSNKRAETGSLSKRSKNLSSPKAQPSGVKPRPPDTDATASRQKPVRTLTSSENQSIRRVVSISRTSRRTPPLGTPSEKPLNKRGTPNTATPPSPNGSIQQKQRPSTAPSSRRSSINKILERKDSKDQKVPGLKESLQEHRQELQKKMPFPKPPAKPKVPTEGRMCRATLQALTQGVGGGGSISAPSTPSHKGASPSLRQARNFTRGTASSSFRQKYATLALPYSPSTSSDSTTKSLPKNPSSVVAPPISSPLTRTASLRTTSKTSHLHISLSCPLTRSQSIRAPPCSATHESHTAPPQGHRQNDSRSFSNQSAHSKASGKSKRPSWR